MGYRDRHRHCCSRHGLELQGTAKCRLPSALLDARNKVHGTCSKGTEHAMLTAAQLTREDFDLPTLAPRLRALGAEVSSVGHTIPKRRTEARRISNYLCQRMHCPHVPVVHLADRA